MSFDKFLSGTEYGNKISCSISLFMQNNKGHAWIVPQITTIYWYDDRTTQNKQTIIQVIQQVKSKSLYYI